MSTSYVKDIHKHKARVNNNKTLNKMSLHFSKTPNKEKLKTRGLYRQEETFICAFQQWQRRGEDQTVPTHRPLEKVAVSMFA